MPDALGGRRIDLAPGGHRAGQRNLCCARIGGQGSADIAISLNDIEQACRRTCFDKNFRQFQSTQRGELGRFEHHGVAAGQRGSCLPGGDLGGIVPRPNAYAHAKRFAARIGKVVTQRNGFTVDRRCDAAEKLQSFGARGGVGDKGFLDRLAGVEGFEFAQLLIARHDDVGGTAQDAAARHGREGGPLLLSAMGGLERLFDDGGRCRMERGDHLAGGRENAVDGLAGGVFDIGSVDKMAGLGLSVDHCSPRGKRLESSRWLRSM